MASRKPDNLSGEQKEALSADKAALKDLLYSIEVKMIKTNKESLAGRRLEWSQFETHDPLPHVTLRELRDEILKRMERLEEIDLENSRTWMSMVRTEIASIANPDQKVVELLGSLVDSFETELKKRSTSEPADVQKGVKEAIDKNQ